MINSLAVSVDLLGGLFTGLFLATDTFLIWAAFVAWASFFYHSGGRAAAFRSTLVSNLFGVWVAWTAALAFASVPPGSLVGSAIIATSIIIYILGAHIRTFSSVPAATYGYPCTFSFLTPRPEAFKPTAMLSLSSHHALFIVPFFNGYRSMLRLCLSPPHGGDS
ncbi:DUF1097 domain-containing protein [Methylobacterium sp. 190mf]|uniref:DUF1097 domain-containing protein n=1 Tax=Methylobacterium sp. 190mf TaxID=1761798 RepID=UPI000CDF1778|nr:DUF1097 domain-containing protein [Methylobacterium sp. 190mf]